jgi:hypothetical protein
MASIQDGPQAKKDLLKVDPEKHWVYCTQLQNQWDHEFSKDATLIE